MKTILLVMLEIKNDAHNSAQKKLLIAYSRLSFSPNGNLFSLVK